MLLKKTQKGSFAPPIFIKLLGWLLVIGKLVIGYWEIGYWLLVIGQISIYSKFDQ
jgi:hypothetical protein